MDDDTLKKFLPKLGDRIAISEFSKRKVTCKKFSLIEKLREKLNNKRGKDGDTDAEEYKVKKACTRETKMIEIGWLCSVDGNRLVHVQTKFGGGSRKISVNRSCKMADVLKKAKELFFPDGTSPKGKLENFSCKILDFKHNEIESELTIDEIYNATRLTRLRFYLATTKKQATVSKAFNCQIDNRNAATSVHTLISTEQVSINSMV